MYPYLLLKHAHSGLAYLSILLFAVRGGLLLGGHRTILQRKIVRVMPHVIDTLLLACAITLVVMGNWPILSTAWLQAKILALLVYIGLGMVAFRSPTPHIRLMAFVGALAAVFYILLVAKTKMVLPL